MRTYKTEQVTQEVQKLDSVMCDKCHKTIQVVDGNVGWIQGGQINISCTFGSKFDCGWIENDKFDLCDDCIKEFVESFGWKDLLGLYQTQNFKTGCEKLMNATPEELGEAAVNQVKKDKE